MVEEQRGLGLVIPIGDEDVAESAKGLHERREAAAKENARSYARGFSVSGASGGGGFSLTSVDAESALKSSTANPPSSYSGSRKMSLPGEALMDTLRNGLRQLDFEEYHEAGVLFAVFDTRKICSLHTYTVNYGNTRIS